MTLLTSPERFIPNLVGEAVVSRKIRSSSLAIVELCRKQTPLIIYFVLLFHIT